MSSSELVNMIFGGISALCALYGFYTTITNNNTKKEIKNIEERVKSAESEYIRKTKRLDDILMLQPLISQIGELEKKFNKSHSNSQVKLELKAYREIRDELVVIKNVIPEEYDDITEGVKNIIEALSYCIDNGKVLKELARESMYTKGKIESSFTSTTKKISTVIRSMKYQ